ncbi:MAG: CDP-diacylglycerol--glycerol-3-phosphate 3-phosphatidyltransferase [Bacilli bacterium]|nr:CDP-diacylglycerol--glycerol-3-phosphate 3-phosphatidyltransferase [Bacilli bacterium]
MSKLNTPNKITTIRLGMCVLMILVFSLSYIPGALDSWASNFVIAGFSIGFNWIDLTCFVIFILGSITDAIDGHIARSRNLVTDFGKFLDPLADKALTDAAFILLSTRTDWYGHYQVLPFLVIFFILRDLAMDGLRIFANAKQRVLAANIYGKVKTAFEMILIPILFLNGFPFSLLNVTGGLDAWMSQRWSGTYIVTNCLTGLCLFFSLLSAVIYFKNNKDLFAGRK